MKRLIEGQLYFDDHSKETVEFRYLGKTGLAIVCEPGDSGGGMQSSWGVKPSRLYPINEPKTGIKRFCSECGQLIKS